MIQIVVAVVGALVLWIIIFNVRKRTRERQLQDQRGLQTAVDFASLFEKPAERCVAEKLFPYLQMRTSTHQVPFRKDDFLWEPPLSFGKDDLEDALRLGFWDELDLGLTAENRDFGEQYLSAQTVGELVCRIAAIYNDRYGSVPHSF